MEFSGIIGICAGLGLSLGIFMFGGLLVDYIRNERRTK